MALEIQSMEDENSRDFQFLMTEINRLSKCFRWSERKEPITSIANLEKIQTCHFCNLRGHKIKNCKIFDKSKIKKKSKTEILEVYKITSNQKQTAQETKIIMTEKSMQTSHNSEDKSTQQNPAKILMHEKSIQTTQNGQSVSIQTAETKRNVLNKFSQTLFPIFSDHISTQASQNLNFFSKSTDTNYKPKKFGNSKPYTNFQTNYSNVSNQKLSEISKNQKVFCVPSAEICKPNNFENPKTNENYRYNKSLNGQNYNNRRGTHDYNYSYHDTYSAYNERDHDKFQEMTGVLEDLLEKPFLKSLTKFE